MDSAEFLDLLGNANRRRILSLLSQKPCYVTEISEQLGVSPKAVIDHLKKLEDAGLVESRTDDRRRKYFSIAEHVSLEVTVSPYEFGTRSAYPSSTRFDITSCRQVSVDLDSLDGDDDSDDEERPRMGPTRSGTGAPGTRVSTGSTAEKPPDETPPDANPATGGMATGSGRDATANASPGTGDERTDPGNEAATEDVATLARQLHEFEQLERELSLLHRWAEGRIAGLRESLAGRIEVANPRLVSEALVALAEEPQGTEQLCQRLGAPPPVVEELLDMLAHRGVVRREGRRWHLAE